MNDPTNIVLQREFINQLYQSMDWMISDLNDEFPKGSHLVKMERIMLQSPEKAAMILNWLMENCGGEYMFVPTGIIFRNTDDHFLATLKFAT